jgi:hypothetical protein
MRVFREPVFTAEEERPVLDTGEAATGRVKKKVG